MFNYLTFFRRKFRYHNPSVAIPKKTRHRVEQLHILWNRCPLSAYVPLFEELFQISRNLVLNLWNYSTQYGTVPLCVGLLGYCPLRWNNAFVTFLTSIQLSTSPDLPSKTGQHRQRCWQGKKFWQTGAGIGTGVWNLELGARIWKCGWVLGAGSGTGSGDLILAVGTGGWDLKVGADTWGWDLEKRLGLWSGSRTWERESGAWGWDLEYESPFLSSSISQRPLYHTPVPNASPQ